MLNLLGFLSLLYQIYVRLLHVVGKITIFFFITVFNKLTQKPFISVADRGDDSEESDNLFGDCSSDEYQPDNNDCDDSDRENVVNKPKKRKLHKKIFQRSENDIGIITGNNDAFNDHDIVVKNGEDLLVTDENRTNN